MDLKKKPIHVINSPLPTTTRVPQLFGWHALQSPLDTVINCSLYHMSEAVLTSVPRLR